ncbi:MAG: NAD(P)-dependent oxidoreductase [Bacteroidia bacterium]
MPKVLIVDDVHPVLIDGLTEKGFSVLYIPESSRNQIIEKLKEGFEILVIRTKTMVDKEMLQSAQNLQIIARAGAGLDNIDEEEAQKLGILCINAGEANSDAVGDHTLAMLLGGLNNLYQAQTEVRNKIWLREENRGVELAGKTAAIIGYGNTGKAVAKRLVAFGVKVLAYDKYLNGFSSEQIFEASMNEIFENADILSLHIPLTSETKGMVNLQFLQKFKKPIFFLNLSRGKIVNTTELIQAIKTGIVWKCALDVLENEKFDTFNAAQEKDFEFLSNSSKVSLSPHIGGWTVESYKKISTVLLLKLLDIHGQ